MDKSKEDKLFCAVYRSDKKIDSYLYIKNKDNFDDLPEALLKLLSPLIFVMVINLGSRKKLARVDINKVKSALLNEGFYLQLPPVLNTTNELDSPYLNQLG